MPFRLADAIFWIAVACCSVAQLAIIRSVFISPATAPDGDTVTPASGARRAGEIAWAIIPGVALVFVFLATWRAMR